MAFKLNLWSFLTLVFVAYMSHSVYQLYHIYFPKKCSEVIKAGSRGQLCLHSALDPKTDNIRLRLYTSIYGSTPSLNFKSPVLWKDSFSLTSNFEEVISINLPEKTVTNGTLWLHAFIFPRQTNKPENSMAFEDDPRLSDWYIERKSLITTFTVSLPETINLMHSGSPKSSDEKKNISASSTDKPVTHLHSIVTLMGMDEKFSFFWNEVPGELVGYLQLDKRRQYLPIFTIDEFSYRIRDLVKVKADGERRANLTIRYQPVSIGKLRLLHTAKQSMESLKSLGFTDKDVDEVKGIFTDTNFYFLALTFAIAAVHLLLDFLAFKNDISFWRNRKTMIGLSTTTLMWRCFSQAIILLYLLDENTSLLVSVPAGLGILIEIWKLTKAFKVSVTFDGCFKIPKFALGVTSKQEQETADFDSQGMHYLVYLLTPLCLCGAVYSLLYVPHKSWYSWFVQSLANAVYAFGFLFMLPQLFINYKLKSVAHLPWRAFMYKAFNTFIDDLFAFIISMPTAHRLACFRDDVVFVIYLYQRHLYPVDKSRINEFGESFDERPTKDSSLKEKKTK